MDMETTGQDKVAERTLEVQEQIDIEGTACRNLLDSVNRLASRLLIVLREAPPTGPDEAAMQQLCPLATSIRSNRMVTEDTAAIVADLLDRLEL